MEERRKKNMKKVNRVYMKDLGKFEGVKIISSKSMQILNKIEKK